MKRLLIVEDNHELQDILKERFSQEDLEVIQAFTGEEGLSAVTQSPPDMVLLDIMLPGKMSGHDVLSHMKDDPQLRYIPVAIFSNVDDARRMSFSLDNIDYMLKANTPLEDVVTVVKTHINKSKPTY
jgi:CheY-like chemotaxis protein